MFAPLLNNHFPVFFFQLVTNMLPDWLFKQAGHELSKINSEGKSFKEEGMRKKMYFMYIFFDFAV